MLLHSTVYTHLLFAVWAFVENVLKGIDTEWNQTTAKPTTTGKTTKKHIFLEFAINYYIGTQETFQTAENLGSLSNVLQGWSWQVVVPQIIYLKRKTDFSKISPQIHAKYQNLKMVYFYIPIKHPILVSKYCILDLKSPYIP